MERLPQEPAELGEDHMLDHRSASMFSHRFQHPFERVLGSPVPGGVRRIDPRILQRALEPGIIRGIESHLGRFGAQGVQNGPETDGDHPRNLRCQSGTSSSPTPGPEVGT